MNGLNRGSEDECRLRANNCVYRLMPLLNLKAEIMNIFRPDDEMSGGWLRMVNGQQEASKSGDWPIRGQERWWGCILVKSKYRCHLLLSGSLACSCQSAASFLLASDWSAILSLGLWLAAAVIPVLQCCRHRLMPPACAACCSSQDDCGTLINTHRLWWTRRICSEMRRGFDAGYVRASGQLMTSAPTQDAVAWPQMEITQSWGYYHIPNREEKEFY